MSASKTLKFRYGVQDHWIGSAHLQIWHSVVIKVRKPVWLGRPQQAKHSQLRRS